MKYYKSKQIITDISLKTQKNIRKICFKYNNNNEPIHAFRPRTR